MGKKGYILLILLGIFSLINGQNIKHSLLSANMISFHHSLYVYGYEQSNTNLKFKCFSYSQQLNILDSIEFNLGKHTLSNYLEISVDTLHECLNFYFQLANQTNVVTLLRFNDTLKIIGFTENYDANHINSLSVFNDEKYAFQQDLYVIRTAADSSEKQFYLSKYHVKSMNKPFEYDYQWQFAFERKYIYRASIIYADTTHVIVYTHVFDGLKKGQWLLRINAKNGEIIKGTKLNPKGDTRHFLMSNFIIDKKTNHIDVIGSTYDANIIDFKNNTSNFTNQSKNHKLFLINIDSMGSIISRVEKEFPLPIQTKTGNVLQSFHLKIREFTKNVDGSFSVWSDMYEQTQLNTLAYYSSWQFNIIPSDADYNIVRSPFTISSKVIPNFISFAKGDTYGKFILQTIGEYDKFKYQKPLNDVIIKTGLDNTNNAFYVLKKTDILSAKKTYYYIYKDKKGLGSKVILKSEQGQNARIIFSNNNSYITFITNIGNTEYILNTSNINELQQK